MKNLVCFCLLAFVAFVPQKAEAQFGWFVDAIEFVGDVGDVCFSAAGLGVDTVCAAAGATVEAAGQVGTAAVVTIATGGATFYVDDVRNFCSARMSRAAAAYVDMADTVCLSAGEVANAAGAVAEHFK